jgi:hypothetical protein
MARQVSHYYSTPEAYQNHYVGIFDQLDEATRAAVIESLEKINSKYTLLATKDGKYFVGDKELDPKHPEEWGAVIMSEMAQKLLRK